MITSAIQLWAGELRSEEAEIFKKSFLIRPLRYGLVFDSPQIYLSRKYEN